MRYKIDYDGLKKFLETLTYKSIKDGALIEAETRDDIDFFCKTNEDKSEITLDQVVEYGMPFLVDAIGNDLSVCILTRKNYKLPTGRLIGAKFDRTIINDCRKTFGDYTNGCFVIPDKFIKK